MWCPEENRTNWRGNIRLAVEKIKPIFSKRLSISPLDSLIQNHQELNWKQNEKNINEVQIVDKNRRILFIDLEIKD